MIRSTLAGTSVRRGFRGFLLLVGGSCFLPTVFACEAEGPTVVVKHQLGPSLLVRSVRFNGCVWPDVLNENQVTSPRRCLPGRAFVYFEACDTTAKESSNRFVAYQTTFTVEGDASDTIRVVLDLTTRIADVNAPGVYGH